MTLTRLTRKATLTFALIAGTLFTINAQMVVTIGPAVNFNPNAGLNKMLKDFNALPYSSENFAIKTYSFGLSGALDAQLDGGYLSVFNFHYERSSNDGFYEDSLDSYDYHSYRVFTSFGVMNVTRGSSSGWFIKLEPLCFGRQKMRLTTRHIDKVAGSESESNHKAIWTNTLLPQWTPGIGMGKDMGLLRVYAAARTCVPRTPNNLPENIGLNSANYSSRVGYFSVSLHVQLRLGGN